jgi:hypothetical protein
MRLLIEGSRTALCQRRFANGATAASHTLKQLVSAADAVKTRSRKQGREQIHDARKKVVRTANTIPG